MKLHKIKELIKGEVAILWFWKEGKSSLKFLLELWAKNITILDRNNIELTNTDSKIKSISWKDYLKDLNRFNLIIKSPWISPYNNNLSVYSDIITTQSEIFTNNYSWKIIWITGTKWKSTTSTVLNLTLQKAWYNSILVWNIWNPVLDEVNILWSDKYDYVVYEMSSYMLEWLDSEFYIGYINNLYNCHLDWHEWKPNYTNAKLNIIKKAKNKICNIELKELTKEIPWISYFWDGTNFVYNTNKEFIVDWKVVLIDQNFSLEWIHNRINSVWIIAILRQIMKDKHWSEWVFSKLMEWLKHVLETFNWLPHRIENIWTYKWITFIDDAIATTPESTIAAIKTFEHKIWTLLLWWQDSWFKFDKLKEFIEKFNISNIVLFPDTWEKIFWDLTNYNYETTFELSINSHKINILKTKSMEEAVKFWYTSTNEWEICLLSNAAPSFSLWSWYIEKWLLFQELVKKYSK